MSYPISFDPRANQRPMEVFTSEVINAHLDRALERLMKDDYKLFEYDVNERTICGRLAFHLQFEFPDFHVDCEYNRREEAPKAVKKSDDQEIFELVRLARATRRSSKRRKPFESTDTITVFPDIVVHERGEQERNLLVIEAKKTTSTITDKLDRRKLFVYRKVFGYRFAKILCFGTRSKKSSITKNEFIELD
ncbi:hypothetical protein ACXR0O_13990 [Verrucomicrobiota bacterium sgz303538]